jgi:hypothetical protein
MLLVELLLRPKLVHIYGLFDPRLPDVIMYVGKGHGIKRRW